MHSPHVAPQHTLKDLFVAFLDETVHKDGEGGTHPQAALRIAFALYRQARTRVPAYKELLAGCTSIESAEHFGKLPILAKASYFDAYPIPQRCWDGSLSNGQPTLWPRSLGSELTVALTFERTLRTAFDAAHVSTLAVVAFPLGSWVGGMFTAACLQHLHRKGLNMAIVTPGNKAGDILSLVRELAPLYEQTIVLGYPPFVKGVVDAGVADGVPWADYNLGLLLAGEVFSEEWRALVAARGGIREPHRRVVSLYGTADAGVIGTETPFSAASRAWLAQHPDESRQLFGTDRLPTLCQYDPSNRLLDTHPDDGTVVVSCLSPLLRADGGECGMAEAPPFGPPVLRYAIGDAGGIMSWEDMRGALERLGADVSMLDAQAGHSARLPFVWVFGRAFWCVSLYGANVYVENIMVGVEHPTVAPFTTGKFVLSVESDEDLNQRLLVRLELSQEHNVADQAWAAMAATAITRELRRLNSEYRNYVPDERAQVAVQLFTYGDDTWFPVGVKHRYTLP